MDAKAELRNDAVTAAALKRAIEARDGRKLASFYSDNALLQIVDRNNPPRSPREVKGNAAIGVFWDDICSRAMTHHVDAVLTESDRIAFSQACAYPDGMKVLCMAICHLKDGRIARQTIIQAWDE